MAGPRGNVYLTAGDQEYPVLFNNRALADAERMLGKSVLQLAQDAERGRLGVGEVAAVLMVGLEAGRRSEKTTAKTFTLPRVYKIMDEVGFPEVTRIVMEGIGEVLAGPSSEGDDDLEEDGEGPPE